MKGDKEKGRKGGELESKRVRLACNGHGILYRPTPPPRPEHSVIISLRARNIIKKVSSSQRPSSCN